MDYSFGQFNRTILDYYKNNKRYLPWRENISPYGVIISEIMLQQTQVSRVLDKYNQFVNTFSNFKEIACSNNTRLIEAWQGLGYNRRAVYLKTIAETIYSKYNNIVPRSPEILEKLPGIGKATSHSIITFIYNIPLIFIETNIRKVFIYHFFSSEKLISDQEIYPYIEKTIDKKNPRQWYYALMDYGTYLSKKKSRNK